MYRDLSEVLLSEEQIRQRTHELGQQIGQEYQGQVPIVVALLKGSGIFIADLVRAIPIHLQMDYMGISSYEGGTHSSGVVKITKDLEETIEGRHVIIAEDIVDTGLTLNYLLKTLRQRNPASLKICSLLNKPARRVMDVHIDYQGFEIEDHFVVGYGLDYMQKYRNMPCIGILKPSVYQEAS